MNLSNLLPYLNRKNDAEVEEKSGPKGVKSQGPATYKTMSSGQIRRAEQRERDTQARKATRRNRRRYMAEQQELANLRGARWVLMNRDKVTPALHDNVVKAMERRYDASLEVDVEVAEEIQRAYANEAVDQLALA